MALTDVSSTLMRECIDSCWSTSRSCLETIEHCLKKGGEHAEASHIGILQNCADICETSARFMISGSTFHLDACALCEDVCMQCADDCDRIDAGDLKMRRCAEMCRGCAESCRNMVSTGRKATA